MGKKKGAGKGRPQQSFEQLVANATLAKFGPYIDQRVNQIGQQIAMQQRDSLENVYTRLMALEEILLEEIENLDKDKLANRVADIQDRSLGLEPVDGAAELGDRARVELRSREEDQAEFQGQSRLLVDNVGSGNTLGKDIEDAILGMKPGESKEVTLEQGKNVVVEVTIQGLSRKVKVEETTDDKNAG